MRLSILTILLSTGLISCNENIPIDNKCLKKYPEIYCFIEPGANISGYHDIDASIAHFKYNVSNAKEPFRQIDSIINSEKWSLKKSSMFEREVSRSDSSYPYHTTLAIHYDTVTKEMAFVWK